MKLKDLLRTAATDSVPGTQDTPSLSGASATDVTIDKHGFFHFPFHDKSLESHFRAKRAPGGYVVVTIEAECDPAKRDPAWHQRQIELMGYKDYRREHRLDWTSSEGDLYYPEFANDPDRFVDASLAVVPDSPVYRGWDFGIRHPACVWFQVIGRRVNVLREVLPAQIDSYSFCKLVMYLSGELELDKLQAYPRAFRWAHKLTEMEPTKWGDKEFKFPKPPWFPEGTRFLDFAGPEVYNPHSNVEKETQERNDYEILASNGIYLGVLATRVAARVAVIRKLMLPQPDDKSRLNISPHCRDLCAGFGGGIAYKKATENDPEPEAPAKDGYYEHLHDAFGYGVINMVKVIEEGPDEKPLGPVREQYELDARKQDLDTDYQAPEIFEDPSVEW